MALIDDISKRLQQTNLDKGPQVGQKEIEKVLAAKKGKAAPTTSPAASSIQEQTAQAQVESAQRLGQQEGQLAAAGLQQQAGIQKQQMDLAKQQLASKKKISQGDLLAQKTMTLEDIQAREEDARSKRSAQENMQLDAMQSTFSNNLNKLAADRDISLNNLFGEFERSNEDLEFRKDAAELEQAAFMLNMANRSYLDELTRVGQERRLSNDMEFRQEAQRLVLDDNLNALMEDIGFTESFNADQRTFEKQMTQAGRTYALDMAKAMLKDEANRQIAAGLGSAVITGATYAAQKGMFDETPKTTKEGQ